MGRLRKLWVVVLCVVLLSGMTVHADGYTDFHVSNQTGKAGDTVTVPVEFNSGQEVGGFQIAIYYDSNVMEFESLERGDLIIEEGQGIFDYNHIPESSKIIVVYVVADTVKDEGVIVDLKFKLKQDCGEQLPIGMGVDQLIDNKENGSPITGEVSGVDEAFQAQIMAQTGGNTVVAEENDKAQAEDLLKEETKEAGKTPEAGQGSEDQELSAAQKETKTENGMGTILAVIIVAIVIVVGGLLIWIIKKGRK